MLGAGVGWITINHGREDVIAALRAEFPSVPAALVVIDNIEFGRMQGRQLRNLLPNGGTTLFVRGDPSETACRRRLQGFMEEIGDASIALEEVDGQWETHVAEPAVRRWIMSPLRSHQPLHAVVCQNDHMGIGARDALVRAADELKRPDLMRVPVVGGDGLRDFGQRWVDQKRLTATVCVTLPGRPVIKLLARYWRDGTPLPPVTWLPVTSYPSLGALSPTGP
jgi:ABC-type sugar transport system substrate-binding protein